MSAANGVAEADFFVDYNTAVLQFVEGGAKATKEVGGVHIQSLDNSSAPTRRTFSLQFIAKEEGDATVFIRNGANVTDGEGNALSLKTDRIEMAVNATGEAGETSQTPGPEGSPAAPPEPTKKPSDNCKIQMLDTNALRMSPEFDPTVRTYEAEVSADTQTFFLDYKLANKKAKATVKGNRDLAFGVNRVVLTVTAESGKKKRYVFMVTRLQEPAVSDTIGAVSGPATDTQEPLDKESNNGYSIILYVVIGLLAVFAISMVVLVKRQQRELQYYYEEEEREETRETEDDRGSGEGDLEGSEVRGEDGEFRYWD